MAVVHGILHLGGPVYRYGGYTFEMHHYCGPIVLKKNLEPRKNQPTSERDPFWSVFGRWQGLSEKEQAATKLDTPHGAIFFSSRP